MTRRFLLSLGAATVTTARPKSPKSSGKVPTTEEDLNRFATHYNAYVNNLHNGFVDLKTWERAKRAWRDMAGD